METELTDEEKTQRISLATKLFHESLNSLSAPDVDIAANDGNKLIERLGKAIPAVLSAVWSELGTLVSLLLDYKNGTYKQIPFGSIAAVAAAVIYVVSPVDAIPDFIPIIGYLDDVAVVKLCIAMVKVDLSQYRQWKSQVTMHCTTARDGAELGGK